ncbi:MAG: hypothetical protein JWN70_4455 [Planctomycetaceae bacterium]|nr:hypothetical protein [Planctomycetaceae bacterium]
MAQRHQKTGGPGYREVYSAFITLRNGKKIYAWQKGLKAFRFFVSDAKPKTKR